MSMKLKNLLNLTEQAPQPPQAAPVPAPSLPPSDIETPEVEPAAQEPGADTAPTPTDPSEYDFTRDFRAFEDAKNKAEAVAKKKLLDKMNKMILGKKIIGNASRGYGQPKTDYTVDKVKKVSVEFWYKDWVVIVTDENDKKFFLTPGVNIKIEAPGTGQPAEPAQDNAPAEPQAAEQPPVGQPSTEAPNPTAEPEAPAPEPTAEPEAEAPAQPGAVEKPAAPTAPTAAKAPVAPGEEPPENVVPVDFKKKKKPLAVAAEVVKLFKETVGNKISKNAPVTVKVNGTSCIFEIAAKHFTSPFDTRDFMLESKYVMKNRNGSVDVQKIGLNYQFTFDLGNK